MAKNYKKLKKDVEKSFDDFLDTRLKIPVITTKSNIQKGRKVKIDLDYKYTTLKYK